jgi:hypothetical protein
VFKTDGGKLTEWLCSGWDSSLLKFDGEVVEFYSSCGFFWHFHTSALDDDFVFDFAYFGNL